MMAKEYKAQRKQALQALHDAAQIGDLSKVSACSETSFYRRYQSQCSQSLPIKVASLFDAHKEFSPNITRKGKNTILHTALFHNQEGALLDYLIQKGADVSFVNCKGYSPIIVAITHCKDCIALGKLVAAGAKYDAVLDSGTFAGMTPLQVAEKFTNEKAIAFLTRLLANKDATPTIIDDETPKNKKICPICKTLVRYPTQMSRLKDNQAQVEENYRVHGDFGKRKKKSKVYTSSKYLDQFLNHADGETWRKLSGIEFHSTENMKLRKEISETYAVLHAVQECCDRLSGICPATDRALELKDLFVIDLCSGKGITSALGAALFPNNNHFLSIDKMLEHTVPHYFFNNEEHITYMSRDIFSNEILHELQTLVHQHTLQGRTTILVGMHCCGILSERAIELFENIPDIKGIVLSPCCLPKKHELMKRKLEFEPPTTKGENPYPAWCSYLKQRVKYNKSPDGMSDVWMYNDLEMHTEKNYIVAGVR
jgi:hypothetical protein